MLGWATKQRDAELCWLHRVATRTTSVQGGLHDALNSAQNGRRFFGRVLLVLAPVRSRGVRRELFHRARRSRDGGTVLVNLRHHAVARLGSERFERRHHLARQPVVPLRQQSHDLGDIAEPAVLDLILDALGRAVREGGYIFQQQP